MNEHDRESALEKQDRDRPKTYQIKVAGRLDEHWSGWFDGLMVTHDAEDHTLLTGPVVDQSALLGLLLKVHNLGLKLISVVRISNEGTNRDV